MSTRFDSVPRKDFKLASNDLEGPISMSLHEVELPHFEWTIVL